MSRLTVIAALAALPCLLNEANGEPVRGRSAKAPARQEICETVRAIATGFGQANVTEFADGNLDLVIDGAKNRLAEKGAKGFSVRKRGVACEHYIDFGGAIGREHKCSASAQLCGKS